tara:strand:- start:11 stop:295 length:285 start_codon:yes stop_codon:yes gene_type:complete
MSTIAEGLEWQRSITQKIRLPRHCRGASCCADPVLGWVASFLARCLVVLREAGERTRLGVRGSRPSICCPENLWLAASFSKGEFRVDDHRAVID